MRVLLTADTAGGVWTYAAALGRGLRAAGVDVHLATLGGLPSDAQREQARGLTLHESAYKLEWMPDPWDDVERAGGWLLSLGRRLSPDLVHLNHFAHGDLPWRAPRIVAGHSCVLSWWRAVRGGEAPPEWDVYRERVRRGLQAADLVMAPSHAMLCSLRRDYGPFNSDQAVYNGCDPGPGAVKEPFVLCAGRLWDDAKNLGLVAAAAPRLSWPVYCAGDGGANQTIRHLGRMAHADLRGWMARASIYCLPARYEPFGLSILEAALAGCALVLGDIPSLREIWGDAAVYVDPCDPDALASALQNLIGWDALRTDYAARARGRARCYRLSTFISATLSAYRLLVPHPAAAPAR